jgi:hypothetical protein
MQSSSSQHNCADMNDLTEENGLCSWGNKVPSMVIISTPAIQQEEPPKIAPSTPDTKRRLRDYTKCLGQSFDEGVPSMTTTSLKKPASLSLSPSSGSNRRRSLARSNTYNSLQSALSADSQGSTSTRTTDGGWTDQVDFVLKIPSAKLKRQKEHRSSVQELRELLHRRKPGLIKKSLLALKAELDQSTSSSCEQHNNASRGLFDESDRKHSDNEVLGRMIRRKPKKSIIQREIEASMSHCSDSFESLDAQGLQQLFGSEILSRRGNSRRANSWEELFVDLKMETARKADFVRSPSSRTIGSNDGIMKGDLKV